MEQKILDEAVRLNTQKEELTELLKTIESPRTGFLTYCVRNSVCTEYKMLDPHSRNLIGGILMKHDWAIQKEIKERIDATQKEIDELDQENELAEPLVDNMEERINKKFDIIWIVLLFLCGIVTGILVGLNV